jgi:hypothetical protein
MNGRNCKYLALAVMAMASFLVLNQGCKGKLPVASAMAGPKAAVPTPTPCVFLLNDCESLSSGNGVFTGTGTGVAVAISPYNATQGSHSLKVTLSTGGYNNMLTFTGFYPNRWTNVSKIVMDVTADATLVTGSYNQFSLVGQSAASAKWWSPLTSNVSVVAGSQSITFTLDWTLGNILPTEVIDDVVLVWNTGGSGTGNFYIDNIRLISTSSECIPPEPTTCGLMSSFETPYDNGTVASDASSYSISYSPNHATQGVNALQSTLLTGGGSHLFYWSGFFPNRWPDVAQVVMDVYVDPNLIGSGYNQLSLVATGTGTYWNLITANVGVVAGAQSVTFNVDWSLGTMNPATATVTGLYLLWNTGGTGTGVFSIDNVRLLNGPSCNP